MQRKPTRPVSVAEKSQNAKLGPVSATYLSQATCPNTCPLRNSGCYAENGLMSLRTAWLNRAEVKSLDDVYRQEARMIDDLTGTRDLRLRVVGDQRTTRGLRIVVKAAQRYLERGKGKTRVWSYTHNWKRIRASEWGPVSTLASCETPEQVFEADKLGYATALVVDKFQSKKAYPIGNGFKLVPCPYTTKGPVKCSTCKLCMNANRLRRSKLVIGFEAHGSGKKKVVEAVGKRLALNLVN